MIVDKKVKLTLVGLDGNAFSLLGAFKNQASKEKWTKTEVDSVINEAMSGDYDHLLVTLSSHCEEENDDEGDFCDDDDYNDEDEQH